MGYFIFFVIVIVIIVIVAKAKNGIGMRLGKHHKHRQVVSLNIKSSRVIIKETQKIKERI